MTSREFAIPTVSSLFSEEQWQQINNLSSQLNSAQKLWLSGYLLPADNSIFAKHIVDQPIANTSLSQTAVTAADETTLAQSGASILIAYGTETGNSEKLAHQLADKARAAGLPVHLANLADMSLRQFAREKTALIICSTHGDGDPPEPIQEFYAALMNEQAGSLTHLRYAVLALGDTSYLPFCETGKQIDQRLTQLGAAALIARSDCDVDYQQTADLWMQASIDKLKEESRAAVESPAEHSSIVMALTAETSKNTNDNIPKNAVQKIAQKSVQPPLQRASRNQPVRAQVLDNICLTHTKAKTAIHHLELALTDNSLGLQAGDAIGIFVKNPPTLVVKIVQLAGLDEATDVVIGDETMPLVEALCTRVDLVIAGKNFLIQWAQWCSQTALQELVAADFTSQREFLKDHQVVDILTRFPAQAEAQLFINSLRPLQPRLYDLATSPTQFADEIHILVKEYRYPFKQRWEAGIASTYLTRVKAGDDLYIYPHHNKKFHLPTKDHVPLIFIATETGAAPYRAFLQEMKTNSRHFPCWLIITGDAQAREVVYQLDWLNARKENQLIYIDPVFSSEKRPPQLSEPITANADRFLQWLLLGAEVYLCGHKETLQACEADIEALVLQYTRAHPIHDGFSWRALISEGRVHRNLY